VDDPKVLAKPWTSAPRRWTLGNGEVYEFHCTSNHELDERGTLKEQESYGKQSNRTAVVEVTYE
jgi:hypothetical protein